MYPFFGSTCAIWQSSTSSPGGTSTLQECEVPLSGGARSSRFTDFEMSTVKLKLASFLLHKRN